MLAENNPAKIKGIKGGSVHDSEKSPQASFSLFLCHVTVIGDMGDRSPLKRFPRERSRPARERRYCISVGDICCHGDIRVYRSTRRY